MELVRGDGLDLALFAIGWTAGWLALWRATPLPTSRVVGRVLDEPRARPTIAVVVPARDEARALPSLLDPLRAQLGAGDDLVVVDDHSSDGTAAVAARHGARPVAAPDLPDGWLGKPHACWVGASATESDVLVFLDADVTPPADLLDRLVGALEPGVVVSVQPWHRTRTPGEQTSILFNVVALMGSGAFGIARRRVRPRVAYGAVIALRRDDYDRAGGHADATIRTMHTEDVGLARAVGDARLFTGRPDVTFRMYPDGLRETLRGWTRTMATGARFGPWWATALVAAWIWSMAGGWFVGAVAYPLSAVQFWVLGRRAGSIRWWTAAAYPVATLVFVALFLVSLVQRVRGADVSWKSRGVASRGR